ncbi:MAG TPA: cytochrome c [Polyangiaceae bacterium]|nr:cytochrome c [Polyangiaceae bacterium]
MTTKTKMVSIQRRAARAACVVTLASVTLAAGCMAPARDDPSPKPTSAAASPPPVSYGDAMANVARRFELVGKAASGGRFELASFEADEIGEVFEGTLPHAEPPKEGHPEVLPETAKAFLQTNVPDLERALESKDQSAIKAAFERTANACNGCHQASGHGFIEIPTVPGHAVPNTDPVAP